MKFCSECGKEIKEETICPCCGYNLVTHEVDPIRQKENEENLKRIMTHAINVHVHNIENIKTNQKEQIKKQIKIDLEKRENKKIPLNELKKYKPLEEIINTIIIANTIVKTQEEDSIILDFKNLEIKHVIMEAHRSKRITKRYQASNELIQKVNTLIKEYNVLIWSFLEKDYINIHYEELNTIFIYTDNDQFIIPQNTILEEDEKEILKEMKKIILEEIKEENLLEETEESGEEIRFKETLMGY